MRNYIGHFSLWGDFEADDITTQLGLKPSAVYPKGEMWEGAEHPAKSTTWDIHCPVELPVNDQINFLLDLLRPSTNVVRRLSERYTAEFNLTCEGEPVLSLSTKELEELAALHVKLNFFINEDEASESFQLTSPECDLLLYQISNELINGFKVKVFEINIGVSEEQARLTFKELRVKHADGSTSLSYHQAFIYRNALAVVLQELGTEEFYTRTGYDYEFGQALLKKLAEFLSGSQPQGAV